MSVAGSTSSHGTHSRSPSRSRSPPYSDGRYPSRYPRYDYNYRNSRSGMSAALDDYRDLRERERDRDRSMLLMREERYLPRGRERERDDRYTPYYRDDISSSHHYPPSSSSSNMMSRDYSKLSSNSIRRDVSTDRNKPNDPKQPSGSSSSSSVKESKDDMKPSLNSSSSDNYGSSRYPDWRERRYRDDDRRRDYDRRREGYMRYDSGYGAPPSMNYQMPPFGGDSYRPDREMPPSPSSHIPYYERDRMDDRDFYRGPVRTGPNDYDRYRGRGRSNWANKPEDSRRIDRERDRPERDNNNLAVSPKSTVQQPPSSLPSSAPKERSKEEDNNSKKEDIVETGGSEKNEALQDTVQDKSPTKMSIPIKTEPISKPDAHLSSSSSVASTSTTTPINTVNEVLPSKESQVKMEPIMEKDSPLVESPIKPEQDSVEYKSHSPEPMTTEQLPLVPSLADVPRQSPMTQEQIVERIGQIENDISMYEDMLEEVTRREEEESNHHPMEVDQEPPKQDDNEEMEQDEGDDEASQRAQQEEAKKQAIQAMGDEAVATDIESMHLTESSVMRKRPQLLINQLRSSDTLDDELYEKIRRDNLKTASKASGIKEDVWMDDEKWNKPLYASIEDYPCYKENMAKFDKLRISIAHSLSVQKASLRKKEHTLKQEYKSLYEQWKDKNLALDRIRNQERKNSTEKFGQRTSSRRRQEEEPDEYVDGIIFTGEHDALRFKNDGASTPYTGNSPWTSDTARSEAELLEIIQSLESAEMRNPESRAKKTTATIPDMILDVQARMRTFDDRSGLVEDPLSYYHTGADTGDVWNQQEVTAFMESYMSYPKQFEKISQNVGTKTAPQCVLFYYRKKKKIDFKGFMKKARRGKNKQRDRLAAAIRTITGGPASTNRRGKSKGSALMTDIGEAQSRKEKENAERKTKELRDLEQANAYWDGVAERKRSKRPSAPPLPFSEPTSSASDDTEMMLQPQSDKRRGLQRRRAREVTQESINPTQVSGPSKPDQIMTEADASSAATPGEEDEEKASPTTTKWTEREKEMATDGFKKHGRNFVQVSSIVGSKTEEQCRNFYHNFKRKYGPNVFNEEDARRSPANTTAATASAPTTPIQQPQKQTGTSTPITSVIPIPSSAQVPAPISAPVPIQKPVSAPQSTRVVIPSSTPASASIPVLTSVQSTPTSAIAKPPTSLALPPVAVATSAMTTTVSTPPSKMAPVTPAPAVPVPGSSPPSEVAVLSGRTDLKAEEEDAAAALVDMFQMGANTTPREEVNKQLALPSRSRTPSASILEESHTSASSPTSSTIQKRRRARTSSSKMDSLSEDGSEWTDPDYGVKSSGRKLGRTISPLESKKPTNSSYWSVSERNDFQKYLETYGRDWEKLSSAMKTKTVIQVRNFYSNNEEKMKLKEIVERHETRQKESTSPLEQSNAAHFQALQNFPFPAPISKQASSSPPPPPQPPKQPKSVSSPYAMNRVGFYPPPQAAERREIYPTSAAATAPPPPSRPYVSPRLATVSTPEPVPSAVTKVADLLNNDDPAEPNQNSWETWFGS
ncbi:hypothetical protein K501DRAFT_245411 [Backusella circina FSU 941]|nr:hypothetical protein K501DRAFT_245411 [Backusella circina FSU 941]